MTIDQAIKVLSFWETLFKDYHDQHLKEALRLGIGALKLYQQQKASFDIPSVFRLPGETEE